MRRTASMMKYQVQLFTLQILDMRVIHNGNISGVDKSRNVYVCSTCGKLFNWSDECSWFGSYKQMDNDPNSVTYYCSEKCAEPMKKLTNQHES